MRVVGVAGPGTVTGMPEERPSPAGGGVVPPAGSHAAAAGSGLQRRPFHAGAFAGWMLVGALWALSIASVKSIGVFVMPVALIATLVMCLGYIRPQAWPGAIGGVGLVGCYLAFLHRHGPGRTCTGSGDAARCTDLLNPWPFLAAGLVLIVICALISWRWYTRPAQPRYSRR